ncbi:MAG: hypothetical protein V9E86_09770 [Nitrosomonas sp.]
MMRRLKPTAYGKSIRLATISISQSIALSVPQIFGETKLSNTSLQVVRNGFNQIRVLLLNGTTMLLVKSLKLARPTTVRHGD